MRGITGSGWGADTWHILQAFQKCLGIFEPLQAAPLKLEDRITPPLWGGTIGWQYTYNGCESNFLDCYFLDHSPCPRINLDVSYNPGVANVDANRFEPNRSADASPEWWDRVMGTPTAAIPTHMIQNLYGLPAEQVVYTYFFRPKYEIRRIIHERMQRFRLINECAIMHVRRGDIIMHTGKIAADILNSTKVFLGQARGYVKIHTYVKAGRALMDAFGVQHVFLVTDSQGAVDEAMACAREHPDICRDLTFRFLEKKRWVGAEGGM